MKTTKQKIIETLSERGQYDESTFEADYQLCIDNYNFEYDCQDAENHSDFWDYCIENWNAGNSNAVEMLSPGEQGTVNPIMPNSSLDKVIIRTAGNDKIFETEDIDNILV